MRILGMRRTLWVVTDELAPVVDAACTRAVAARERARLEQFVAQSDLAEDPAVWIDRVAAATLDALRDRGEAFTSDLTRADPLLATKIRLGAGTRWEARSARDHASFRCSRPRARIVRGRPRGGWTHGQYRWALAPDRDAELDTATCPGRAAPPLARVVRAGDRDRHPLVDRLDGARGARSARGRSSRRRRPGRVIRARPRGRPRARPAARAVGVPPADPRPDDDGLEGTGLVPRPACRAALRPERQRRPDRLVGRPRRRRLVAAEGRGDRLRNPRGRRHGGRAGGRGRGRAAPGGSGTSGSRPDSFPRSSARSPADPNAKWGCDRDSGRLQGLPRRRRGSSGGNPLLRNPAREQAQPRKISFAITSRWICDVPS